MARVTYWERRLIEAVDKCRGAEISTGSLDCGLFAADCVLAVTGVDYMEDFRGKYKTQKGALRLLKKYADGTIEGYLASLFSEHLNAKLARRGDVVLYTFREEDGPSVGVCCGDISAFVEEEHGVIFIKTVMCNKAYKVD